MSNTGYLQTCRLCSHEFRAPVALVGKKVACPYCRRPMEVVANAAANEDKLVGKELGGCRLIRRLGAGAIGVVYEAEQLSVGRKVAVKMLSSKAANDQKVVQRFQREAKLCAQIQHPNVVSVYDCGFERGVHYLIMEYVDGTTLAGMVDERDRLPWREATKLILQVARGVEHAHGLGIVHRDIKPANILVSTDGNAKLADLGLAKQLEDERNITADEGLGLTMQGVALGSPAYMPPEQIRSAKDVTPASDLYALGASFYQLVTGVLPFDGRTAPEVMTKVLRETAKPIVELVNDVPPAIVAFIDRTLSKDPAGRPADASRFIVELEDAMARPDHVPSVGKPRTGKRSSPGNQVARGRSDASGSQFRTTVIAIIAIVATLGAGAALYWKFFH